ncbi:MAG: hypothetical protein RI101_08985 [Nitrospira sp.]|jgi:hypothetical protein|nr:hypothetical protein [Nitrospira sp.]
MFKFLMMLILLAASFGAGYYFGQRPVGTLQQTVSHLSERWTVSQKTIAELQQSIKNLSHNVVDTTIGIERDLRRRQGLVEAKSHLVQAKIQVLDRNFGAAAKELAQAGDALEQAVKEEQADSEMRGLAAKMKALRGDVTKGQLIPMKKLDELQQALDRQLNK